MKDFPYLLPMQLKLFITACLLSVLLVQACTSRLYYSPEALNWQQEADSLPQQPSYTVYLLGDAGAPKLDKTEPTFRLLRTQLLQEPQERSALLVLGDNIYFDGLPEPGAHDREKSEQKLDEQLKIVKDYPGQVYFIPGNHDWDYMGKRGLARIRMQEQYIEQHLGRGNTFIPDNGCPGPVAVPLGDNAVFIAIDSQWWLHKHEKPYGRGSSCDPYDEATMLRRMEELLEQNRSKHVIVGAHHPLISNSNHGGFYNVMDHLFPLRLVRDGLYFPLPVIGSLYPFYRKYGGVDQDIPHPRYQQLIHELTELFNRHDNIIFAAGHDHNLQLHRSGSMIHILSGSGCKTNFVEHGHDAIFLHREKGFTKVQYYPNGEVWVEFWSPADDGNSGRLNYRGKLYDKQLAPDDVYCDRSDSPTAPGQVTLRLTEKAPSENRLRRFLLGSHYEREWATPVQAPALDLARQHGGLIPYSTTNALFRHTLRLQTLERNEYSFLPLQRDPRRLLPADYRRPSASGKNRRTRISAQHPYALVIATPLTAAAGVLYTTPTLYALPDNSCLGPFQSSFGGQAGFLKEEAGNYHAEQFGQEYSAQVISYESLIDELENSGRNQADAENFAKARLLDMLIGDWDRHEQQYLWAAFPGNGKTLYRPVPLDRDNAFFSFNGTLPWLVSRRWGFRSLKHFDEKIKDLKGLNNAARHMDRRLLSSLTEEQWKQAADELQSQLTDSVIEAAVRNMPPEVFPLSGPDIIRKLKARRAQLPQVAAGYYRLLARYADVYGSDEPELFEINRLPHRKTEIVVYSTDSAGNRQQELYRRTFSRTETKEIRLYGLGSDDAFASNGNSGSRRNILVRISGGDGRDNIYQQGGRQQPEKTIAYEVEDDAIKQVPQTDIDFHSGEVVRTVRADRFFYNTLSPNFSFLYNEYDGIFSGIGLRYRIYKFRRLPYGSEHSLLFQHASRTGVSRLFYQSTVKNLLKGLDLESQAWMYLPAYQMPYANHSARTETGTGPVETEVRHIYLNAALSKPFATFFAVGAGPVYQFFRLRTSKGDPLPALPPAGTASPYSTRQYLGLRAFARAGIKDNLYNPARGLLMQGSAEWNKKLSRSASNYTQLQYNITYYMSPSLPLQLTLAGRLGGTITTGSYAFYQAGMLGGGALPDLSQNLRGYAHTRFIGDRTLYLNLELRSELVRYRLYLLPVKMGLLGLWDHGRVNARQLPEAEWHRAWGGGIWASFLNRFVLSGTLARSTEGNFVNLQKGFFF